MGPHDMFLADVWSLGVVLFTMVTGFFFVEVAAGHDPRFAVAQQAQQAGFSAIDAIYAMYNRPNPLSRPLVALLDGMLLCNYKTLDFSENSGITDEGIWTFMNVGFELIQLRTLYLARLRSVRKETLVEFANWIRERSHWTDIKQVCVWESVNSPYTIAWLGYEAEGLINAAVDCRRAESAWEKQVARQRVRDAQGH